MALVMQPKTAGFRQVRYIRRLTSKVLKLAVQHSLAYMFRHYDQIDLIFFNL